MPQKDVSFSLTHVILPAPIGLTKNVLISVDDLLYNGTEQKLLNIAAKIKECHGQEFTINPLIIHANRELKNQITEHNHYIFCISNQEKSISRQLLKMVYAQLGKAFHNLSILFSPETLQKTTPTTVLRIENEHGRKSWSIYHLSSLQKTYSGILATIEDTRLMAKESFTDDLKKLPAYIRKFKPDIVLMS